MNTLRRTILDLIHDRQFNRILRLSFPNDDAPAAQFLVDKLDANESLSRDFEFTVELLSDNACIPLKEMQGKLLSIELVRGDGSLRYFSGYVFSFQRRRSDGGMTFYEARLGPWLKFLGFRKDNYLFHGKTLRQQTESIFEDYGVHPRWDWRVTAEDPAMTDACQFDETDFNYLSRRWEAAGWYYWYEHEADGHRLVVASDSTYAPAVDGDVEVRFHGAGGAHDEDAFDRWSPERRFVPANVALSAFDFKDPSPRHASLPTLNQQGDVPELESYEYAGAYGLKGRGDGDAQSRVRMEEIEATARVVEAEGNSRHVAPGRWFRLVDHFNHDFHSGSSDPAKDDFLVLAVRHVATNNYLRSDDEKIQYRNGVTCTRKSYPWRPGRGFNSTRTRILAPQTAVVVGAAGDDNVHTDRYGRVRVQFHWDRIGEHDDRSSAWIRVASAWAGAELGAAAIPRVGMEVIVQWIDGCPDRPLITGAVFNERNMPPWTVPTQQALTGLRSRELVPGGGNRPGGRSNHLVLDDTSGQIQAQLKSDHLHSQLSLGHVTRIDDNRGRLDARGEGWELRTDGHGVVRAGKGMLVTTEPRMQAQSHIKDMGETAERLKTAHGLHDASASAALQGKAQESGHQHDVADALKAQNDAIRGTGGPFPELGEAHLVLSSPAGIETTTAQSTHIASDRHTALTTGRNLSVAAGESFFASVKETFRLFVHKAGMKLVAAAGKITVQAHDGGVEIIANKVLSLISQSDWIDLKGKKGVRLHGSGSMVEISDLVQVFTSKPVQFHGNLQTLGPKNMPHPGAEHKITVADPQTPQEPMHLVFTLHSTAGGRPWSSVPYTLLKDGAKVEDGITDDLGRIAVEHRAGPANYQVQLPNGHVYDLAAVPQFEPAGSDAHREQRLSNTGARAVAGTTASREYC
ncbi:type VI secretion system Vgr family protein [Pseudoduganella chitinolytica]|uniref:Type VI secretion system Vgr family protein n=1 Tax=Pseudoduganella chitinolytica TaxID=34070 RepID=A0ABY8BMH0_9BURK|nr:type VI secretion system Vgr family protein [Pseudoduganella chitinolytica]WEF35499.1 type VI secretion system Vgr family protein [Pseudoduganella chitinolytica]